MAYDLEGDLLMANVILDVAQRTNPHMTEEQARIIRNAAKLHRQRLLDELVKLPKETV